MINKEDMSSWLADPVTVLVFDYLRGIRGDMQEQLTSGATLDRLSVERTAMETTLLLGKISGLNILLEMELGK